MTITKAIINKALKEVGMGFVKVDEEAYTNGKCYKQNDKRVKGIFGSSYSPTNVTNEHNKRANRVQETVQEKLIQLGFRSNKEDNTIVVNEGTKQEIKMLITQEWFPMYSGSHYYGQSGYKNIYIIPQYL